MAYSRRNPRAGLIQKHKIQSPGVYPHRNRKQAELRTAFHTYDKLFSEIIEIPAQKSAASYRAVLKTVYLLQNYAPVPVLCNDMPPARSAEIYCQKIWFHTIPPLSNSPNPCMPWLTLESRPAYALPVSIYFSAR